MKLFKVFQKTNFYLIDFLLHAFKNLYLLQQKQQQQQQKREKLVQFI